MARPTNDQRRIKELEAELEKEKQKAVRNNVLLFEIDARIHHIVELCEVYAQQDDARVQPILSVLDNFRTWIRYAE